MGPAALLQEGERLGLSGLPLKEGLGPDGKCVNGVQTIFANSSTVATQKAFCVLACLLSSVVSNLEDIVASFETVIRV